MIYVYENVECYYVWGDFNGKFGLFVCKIID